MAAVARGRPALGGKTGAMLVAFRAVLARVVARACSVRLVVIRPGMASFALNSKRAVDGVAENILGYIK